MRRLPNINYDLGQEITKRVPWFRKRLMSWFEEYGRTFPWRLPGRAAYEIVVAEILLQRTTSAQVAQIYDRFLKKFPSWSALQNSRIKTLQNFLKPLGLSQQKAEAFRSLALAIEGRGGLLPTSRAELEELPGIGQYIASAVLVTFQRAAEPMLDANMARVLERFFGPRKYADIRSDPYLQTLARKVVHAKESLRINWGILDFGGMICKSRGPLCPECPIRKKCLYYSSNIQAS